ncbi:MAG: hypothetical protein JWP97_6745 [Labilithrix sp.]|nr:hypothetical protein [Labilithrix sp.]
MSDRPPEGRESRSSSSIPSSKGSRVRREKRRRRAARAEAKDVPAARSGRPLFWALVTAGIALAALLAYVLVLYPASSGPGAGKDVELTIEPGESAAAVVDKLDRAGLLVSRSRFALYVRVTSPTFAPGPHLLTDDVSPQELIRRLERLGSAAHAKVTIPEGYNRFDIAKRMQSLHVTSQAAFLEATADPTLLRELRIDGDSAEGFLFPATYELAKDSDPHDVVRRLVSELDKRWTQLEQNHHLGIASLEGAFGWTRREMITLASMVEKEAAVDDERPIIASVFLNRLRDATFKRKVLQCDPTAGYGCLVLRDRVPGCAGYAGKITHAVNSDPQNTYSTYVHEGLPPGPIANPGVKSLQAVLAPATTKYLYFVTRGEARRHAFSETLEEHSAAVKDLKERTATPR